MKKDIRYCSIFLIFAALLILSTGMVSAGDINDTAEIEDNIIADTSCDDTDSLSQGDNTQESQTIEEVETTTDDTDTTTTSQKELTKEDKNLKGRDYTLTLVLSPSSGVGGDNITVTASGTVFKGDTTANVYWDGELIQSVATTASGWKAPTITFLVPGDATPGDHTVKYQFATSSSRNYIATGTFTVIKTSVPTITQDMETVYGEVGCTVIPVTVTDEEGNSLNSSSTLTFMDGDDVLIDNVAIEGGVATVTVPTSRVGEYPITVIFNANKDYDSSNNTVNAVVSKADAVLTVNEYDEDDGLLVIIDALYNTVVTGTLKTSSDVAITDTEITVNVDGTDYTVTTDSEGNFEYKYPATQTAEAIPITIAFNGNDLYNAAESVTGTFDVESIDLTLSLDTVTLSEVNETTTISGSLVDELDNVVANHEVSLTISGVDDEITVTTDSEGKFSYDYVFGEAQDVTVTASVDSQNGLYTCEDATTEFTVVVGPRRTNLTIEVGSGSDTTINIVDVTPYFDEVITNGTLLDIFKEAVSGATIKILINGEDYSVTTDSEGKFSLVYNATEGKTSYNISVQFEGNDDYKPAGEVYTGTFTTEAFDIRVYIDDNFPSEILIGDEVTISGSATLQNQTLKNNEVVLKIDGTSYTTTTDEEGKYSYTYTTTRNGTIPIVANVTFNNADIKTASKDMIVVKPEVNIEVNQVEQSLVLDEITLNGKMAIASNDTPLQGTIDITINNETVSLENNEDGTFTYTFTPEQIGTYNISITHTSERYHINNASMSVSVVKRETQFVENKAPFVVKVDDTFTISGTLVDEANKTLANQEIKFIIDNQEYTNTTDENGAYAYNYVASTVGENFQYEVRYSGNDIYTLARNYIGSYFDVESKEVKMYLKSTESEGITNITGSLTYDDLSIGAGKEVALYIDAADTPVTITTDDDGIFYYEYTPEIAGTHTATAVYTQGTDSSISKTIEFEVPKFTTTIEINDIDATYNDVISISASVKDQYNRSVDAGKAVFKVNGITIKNSNNKVIYALVEDGTATIDDYTVPSTWIKGVNITAVYSGSTNYKASRSEALNVIADKATANMQITSEDITTTRGQTITITSTLTNTDGSNVCEGKVIYKINGKTIKDENNKIISSNVTDGTASVEYTIPENMKYKTFNLTGVFTSNNYKRATDSTNLIITEETTDDSNDTTSESNETTLNSNDTTLKTESATTHIINNDNVDEYMTANGLSDLVSEGDTLDIQGLIDRNRDLVINKAVNIISSTQDAVIYLHSVSTNFDGSDPGNCFIVNNGGSYSNISGLYLNNSQFWVTNAHYVTFDNMSMVVNDSQVGRGVGQTAIRDGSTYVVLKNSFIYTRNNGGSSSFVITYASHCTIENCTVQGSGTVGNILYLNTFNAGVTTEEGNSYNTIRNNTIIGPETSQAICYAFGIDGHDNLIEGNTFNYSGSGIVAASGANPVNNTVINNKFYGGCGIAIRNTECYNNTIYDNGNIVAYSGSTYSNNTSPNAHIYQGNIIFENNTIGKMNITASANITSNTINTLISTASATITNNNITTATLTSTNALSGGIFDNNTVTENLVVQGYRTNRLLSNVQVINNEIGGNIAITNTNNILVDSNTVNGTITILSTAANTNITNNTIITTNPSSIINQAASSLITDNYLISNSYRLLGDNAVSTNVAASIYDNRPLRSEFWQITIDEISATVGETAIITVNLDDELGESMDDGVVYITINDWILSDEDGNPIEVKVSDGKAVLEYTVPSEWLRSDAILTATYVKDDLNVAANTTMDITKRHATVEITTEDLTVASGETITLQARVTDNDELLNGQLAFKLNSHSLKDDENNLICVDVVDGIATLEYVFDESISPDTYTLTAVFENSLYLRSSADETLTVE